MVPVSGYIPVGGGTYAPNQIHSLTNRKYNKSILGAVTIFSLNCILPILNNLKLYYIFIERPIIHKIIIQEIQAIQTMEITVII